FDLMAEKSNYFTTADIIEVINSVAHKAFERELSSGKEYKSDTNDFVAQISSYKPTISKEEMETFRLDAREYTYHSRLSSMVSQCNVFPSALRKIVLVVGKEPWTLRAELPPGCAQE
ncbi:MAG: hypothetical protein KKC21_01010, partial [Nitrospinae bacterium]|nr:hypothetical protein [Nitrospinota bacterium]